MKSDEKVQKAIQDVEKILEMHCTSGNIDDILLEKLRAELKEIQKKYTEKNS